ncbi:MAG TPA: chromosomal replication initiator protein DnaA [Solirubrobacteraceae bacterium]|nr:chromosomal replication initiator protein DnaA [Solirubrobacteraceae bacterium]
MSDDELPHAWHRIQHELRRAVGDSTWHIWLEPLAPRSLEAGVLVVEAPDSIRPWVGGRFSRVLRACTEAVLGQGARVDLVGPGEGVAPTAPAPPPQGAVIAAGSAFNPRFTFDQFVIGDGNRLAHAAAPAVAEMPGLAYNPLFICGPPGLGKTHLLHSIANYVRDHGGGMSVLYTTAEAFTDQFVGALQSGAIEAFKSTYRNVDVLLVDDVQFLQSKARTEQEFFHTFNALQGAGAQLVLTSDRLPRDMDALEDRLRERFESGLVTDVRPPDSPTRLTVLRKRAQQDELSVADTALERIAGRVESNLRTLEGALIRVVAFGSLTGRAVTAELADEVLDGLYPDLKPARAHTVREIQEQTAEAFGVSLEQLLSSNRAAPVAWPRQVAMYLARELTDQTLPQIGRAFGGRNHTTVMHACRRTAERIAADPEAFETVRRLTEQLGGTE